MALTKGKGLVSAVTESKAQKIVSASRRDDASSKPTLRKFQGSCPVCNTRVALKRAGRKRTFCSAACKQSALRNRNFARKSRRWTGGPEALRNAENSPNNSIACKGGFAGPASGISGPREAIRTEIVSALSWQECVSTDGVKSFVAQLRRPALVTA